MDWFSGLGKAAPPAKAPPMSISLPSIPGLSRSKLQLPKLQLPNLRDPYVQIGAASVGALLVLGTVSSALRSTPARIIPSPVESKLPKLSPEEVAELPYPPDALPGARDVQSPYGTVRVYEWGPEDGDKILLIHGISTPGIAMADLAHKLVRRGCRVMMFDLFGRGYSDAPSPLHHNYDSCLYFSQILLCLQSSPIAWSGHRAFTIIGYSLGGAIAADFTSYFPYSVRGLVLVAPGGLIRKKNITFKSKLLYQSSWLPEWMVHRMVANRLWTGKSNVKAIEPEPEAIENAETTTKVDDDTRSVRSGKSSTSKSSRSSTGRKHKHKRRESSPGSRVAAAPELEEIDEDHDGGAGLFISSNRVLLSGVANSTVSGVVDWQVLHHKGFVPAFVSSIRHAPVHEQHERWSVIKENIEQGRGPLREVWLVLGETDPIIIKEELVEDATAVLGEDNLRVRVVEGAGHEVAIERADEVVQVVGSVLGWHRKPHSSSKSKKRSFF
ncbi:alpha/beta-hydrolase [Ophiobolus disseminans]|uniref:Alpha/beta-hydrolase n=1 Tax=Ophiobolus disseminans TaxID=1469910 RepID=A0A6A6ZSH0_9PLEO|nr:alpha/beta-hydrolase [Ophiobolus disseminans]